MLTTTQTTITGNAGTATKLETSRTFAVTGAVSGTISSDLATGVSVDTSIAPTTDLGLISDAVS